MKTINGFGIDIVNDEIIYQCPNCNPITPYNLGNVQSLIHIGDKDNDGLADVLGIKWKCPSCSAQVIVSYENAPKFDWGIKLKNVFKQKEAMFKNVSVLFDELIVDIGGSPDYLDDTFELTADDLIDKKFKICFAVNDLSEYDLYVTTQLQDDESDWGSLPEGWTELDCIMIGTIRAGATDIYRDDIKHILDQNKVTWLS